eukprot:1511592-Rhodomonas_salina.1
MVEVSRPSCLRASYAMPGECGRSSGVGGGDPGTTSCYGFARRCPVLTWQALLLPGVGPGDSGYVAAAAGHGSGYRCRQSALISPRFGRRYYCVR